MLEVIKSHQTHPASGSFFGLIFADLAKAGLEALEYLEAMEKKDEHQKSHLTTWHRNVQRVVARSEMHYSKMYVRLGKPIGRLAAAAAAAAAGKAS